jgi:Uma2 family endonuclease
MPVSAETYEQLVLEDSDHKWELHCGRLVEKPPMTWEHNFAARELHYQLLTQLNRNEWDVIYDMGRVSRTTESFYIPDVYVVPREHQRRLRQPGRMEAYPEPLPLVVEVWSASTGGYDNSSKLPEYRRRGDLEIWFIHPYERTLTVWRRQQDGSYVESHIAGEQVQPMALPGVTVNLDSLFRQP